jgi:hypothetical protein
VKTIYYPTFIHPSTFFLPFFSFLVKEFLQPLPITFCAFLPLRPPHTDRFR